MMRPSIELESAGEAGHRSALLAQRLAVVLLWILAILQGAIFLSGGRIEQRLIGLVVVLGSSVLALARFEDGPRLTGLTLLGMLGLANVAVHVTLAPEPIPLRLLTVTVLTGYLSLCVAGAGAMVFRRSAAGLLVSALAITVGVVAMESVLGALVPALAGRGIDPVRWVGGTSRHPVLEDYYRPHIEARTSYLNNPRGYFTIDDPRLSRWQLASHDQGSAARLLMPGSMHPDGVRVEIDRAQDPMPWHIQLSYGGVAVRNDERYVVAFRARADQPRTISASVSQAHVPWQGLGWSQKMEIGTSWGDHIEVFRSTRTDDQARLNLDLGASTAAVEVQDVQIKRVDTGASSIREMPIAYSVPYRFNDHGCRGPDYVVPAPPDRRRILAIGDDYSLGVGVREEDTFEAQLQTILNANPTSERSPSYDVVNCGAVGFSTQQERKLFEIVAPDYRPDIVILSMVSNDDGSRRSDVQHGYLHLPGRAERLFFSWGLLQLAVHEGRRPPSHFADSLQEVRVLKDLCARMHAQLVVVAFRNEPLASRNWQALVQTMTTGLAGSGVPWLDLGDRLLADHPRESLVVQFNGDPQPNERAHRSAAEQIARLLRAHDLLH